MKTYISMAKGTPRFFANAALAAGKRNNQPIDLLNSGTAQTQLASGTTTKTSFLNNKIYRERFQVESSETANGRFTNSV